MQGKREPLWKVVKKYNGQKALAKIIGTSPQNLNNWINFKHHMPDYYARELVRVTQGTEVALTFSDLTKYTKQYIKKTIKNEKQTDTLQNQIEKSKTFFSFEVIQFINNFIYNDQKLSRAEESYHLPLRAIFIGLISCCDECGKFRWQPTQLKSVILPYIDLDFSRLLDALCSCGFIEKNTIQGKIYGKILFKNLKNIQVFKEKLP